MALPNFPTRTGEVPDYLRAIASECRKPGRGEVGRRLLTVFGRWRREVHLAETLPWPSFSGQEVFWCAVDDFPAYRVRLERAFGPEGDRVIREAFDLEDPFARNTMKSWLFVATAPLTEARRALRLDVRGLRAGLELDRRLEKHVGRHFLLDLLAQRMTQAPPQAQAFAQHIVPDFSAPDSLAAFAEEKEDILTKLAWAQVAEVLKERILQEDRPHFASLRQAQQYLTDVGKFQAFRNDRLGELTLEDLVSATLAGRFNGAAQRIAHRLADRGRQLLGGARDYYNPLGGRRQQDRAQPPPLRVAFKESRAVPSPRAEEQAEARADRVRFLLVHPEHRRGADAVALLGSGEKRATVARRLGVSGETVRKDVAGFWRAFATHQEGPCPCRSPGWPPDRPKPSG